MQVGVVILPEHRWADARAIWRRAEELGFAHAWTYDHLAWRSLRDAPWFGAVPTLTAAALATERIRLGMLVASPNFRQPVPFAKEVITLDDVSGGRFTLGIGAGGAGWDARMLGQKPWSRRERADRFAEFVQLLDRLLREPAVSQRGRYYSADEARTYPGCLQQPRVPFAIAATGLRGMRLAARYAATWVTTGDRTAAAPIPAEVGAQVVRAQIDRLDEACVELGRDPSTLRRLVLTGLTLDAGLSSVESFRHTIGRYTEAGVTDLVVHWPRTSDPYGGDIATFEHIFSAWAATTMSNVRIVPFEARFHEPCKALIAALPEWFGLPDSNAAYLRNLSLLPSWVALVDSEVAGAITLEQHFQASFEVHFMAVRPERHRRGIGRALLDRLEAEVRARAGRWLHVKTLAASHPDPFYARTRAFYEAMGFSPLFESSAFWSADNPTLVLVKLL